MLQKLMSSKPALSESESSAQLSVLKDLKSKLAGDKLKGMQSVKVMSNSPEGLKRGLEKAEELTEKKMKNSLPDDIMPMDEEMDHHSMILQKASEMSPEELDQCIQSLMELKAQKSDLSEEEDESELED